MHIFSQFLSNDGCPYGPCTYEACHGDGTKSKITPLLISTHVQNMKSLIFFLNEIFETTIRSDSVLQSCKQDERRMMSSLQRPRKAQSNPQVSKLVVLIFEAGGEASHASCPALFQVRVAVKRQRPAAGRLSREGRICRGGDLHC